MPTSRDRSGWGNTLMIVSLILLALFEVIWLRDAYRVQKELLEEQQTRHLHSAIRELEDSLFQLTVFTPWLPENGSDTTDNGPRMRIRKSIEDGDSTRIIALTHDLTPGQRDTMRVRTRHPRRGTMILGTLVRQMTVDGDSIRTELVMDEMLKSKINGSLATAPGPHSQLVTWTEGIPDSLGVLSRAYFDVVSGKHYAIGSHEYTGYLLRQMLPQIFFSIILFASIAVSFWLVQRSLRQQRKLALMQSNLIANISHELKTPISTVNVALEALQELKQGDDITRNEYLDIARSEIGRLSLLVEKVLRSSETPNGSGSLKIEHFDFRELLDQILSTLKFQLTRIQGKIYVDAKEGQYDIEADKLHVTGLVHNLLDNALKYGGAEPEINITLDQKNGSIEFSITDHGQGIPREYQARIFDKFFRVPSNDIHNIKGHGLGLAYVDQVVREHGGSIDIDSREGSGSTFTVTLPKHHGG